MAALLNVFCFPYAGGSSWNTAILRASLMASYGCVSGQNHLQDMISRSDPAFPYPSTRSRAFHLPKEDPKEHHR